MQSAEKWEALGGNAGVWVSKEHGFTTDSFLLAWFSMPRSDEACADLGTGCGIIPVLWCARAKPASVLAVELQERACAQAERGFAESGQAPVTLLHADIRAYKSWGRAGSLGLCACNPPYKAAGTGVQNPLESHRLARHEVSCDFSEIAAAAAWLLRWGGRFCCCQRPERLPAVMKELQSAGLEPKRLLLVQQRQKKEPSLFLLEARRGGAPGLRVSPILMIEGEDGNFSPEMLEIYGEYKNERT